MLAAMLVAPLLVIAPPAPTIAGGDRGPITASPDSIVPAALCAGTTTPGTYLGSLLVEGTDPAPPSVANRTVQLSYWVDLNFTPTNGSSLLSCVPQTAFATTDLLGGFSIAAPVPTSTCNKASCSLYSGPFGPITFSIRNATPSGYFVTQSVLGHQATLAYVQALSSTRIAPTSRVTLSTDAPTVVHAFPTAGNGAPSPASVGFAWRLDANGWTIVNGSGTANVTIEASDLASPGTLTVWVNGSYNGTAEAAGPVTLDLAAASTTATGGTAFPTSIDAGNPVTFTVTGQGAGGYVYVANVSPGLGLPSTLAPCASSIVAGGLLALTCTATVTYPAAGTAQPTAQLTNGYSSASYSFAEIAVAPSLAIGVSPTASKTYVGDPIAIAVSTDTATGTSPRGPACVWPGDGRSYCADGPGPTFPFSVAYGSLGGYQGKATLLDGAGTNASAPFSVSVFDRPRLSALSTSTNILGVAQTATILGSVSGGALPLEYYWNSSAPAGLLFEGTATADGSILFAFTPSASGTTRITLTIVDALGTQVSNYTTMNVTAGPAIGLRATVASSGPLLAGDPTSLQWTAVDPVGEVVGDWSNDVALVLTRTSGGSSALPTWVNRSGVPVPPAPDGSFPIPASAWSAGTLRVTVSLAEAGAYSLSLRGGLPLVNVGASSTALSIGPDTDHLALSQPVVVQPGLRSNHTLWQISDRWGNALGGGEILVVTVIDGVASRVPSPVLAGPGAASSVWVNYSVPDGVAATVAIVSESNVTIRTISIPATTGPATLPTAWLLVALGGALAAGASYGLWTRYRRPSAPDPFAGPEAPASEEDLRRWAEGRAHVLQRASTERGQTLDELAGGFVGRPPRPEEMTEWVAALVADGSLRTVLGDDGRSRFLKVSDDREPLRVELDDRALEEALDRRAAIDSPDDGSDGRER